MLPLVAYAAVAFIATAIILAYAAQGAPLPPRPVYPARIEAVAAQHPLNAVHSPVWDARVRRFRDAKGRFVKNPVTV